MTGGLTINAPTDGLWVNGVGGSMIFGVGAGAPNGEVYVHGNLYVEQGAIMEIGRRSPLPHTGLTIFGRARLSSDNPLPITDPLQLTTKEYVDGLAVDCADCDSRFVNVTGDVMNGTLGFNDGTDRGNLFADSSEDAIGVSDRLAVHGPIIGLNGITIAAGDTNIAGAIFQQSGQVAQLGAVQVQNSITVPTPTADNHAATKAYVDNLTAGLAWKDTVRAATTANITLSGTQTVDGVALVAGNRALVKNQTTTSQNGIYVVAAGAWTRATDADSEAELLNAACFVSEGTVNADTAWVMTTNAPITVGTTALTWVQFAGGGAVTAGNGLTQTGNTLNVGAGTGILVGADTVSLDTTYADGRYVATAGDFMTGALQMRAAPIDIADATGATAYGSINGDSTGVQIKATGETSLWADSYELLSVRTTGVIIGKTDGASAPVPLQWTNVAQISANTGDMTLDVLGAGGTMKFRTNSTTRFSISDTDIVVGMGIPLWLSQDPTQPLHAATKQYVDAAVAAGGGGGGGVIAGAGLTLTGSTLDIGQGTGMLVGSDSIAVDTTWADGRYVRKAGDTMTGSLTLSAGAISVQTSDVTSRFGFAATAGGSSLANCFFFGYSGAKNYCHALQSQHNSGTAAGNRIGIALWRPGDGMTAPSNNVATFEGDRIQLNYPVFLNAGNPTLALHAVPKQYVDIVETRERSKGGQLVVNGSGLLGDNYNFTNGNTTFVSADRPPGTSGSFLSGSALNQTFYTDEFIPVDVNKYYVLGAWARETVAGLTGAHAYMGFQPIDTFNNGISPQHVAWQANTTTTLAVALNPGDPTITLTSAAGWNNAAGAATHFRGMIAWNYVDPGGFAWPVHTYSRNSWLDLYADGGISGNVITLRVPWAGPAIPAGTQVSNSSSGGSYMYLAWLGPSTPTPETWTYRDSSAVVFGGGPKLDNAVPTTKFPIPTAKVRVIMLSNRVAGSRTAWAGITLTELLTPLGFSQADADARFVNVAGDTMTGSLSVTGNVTSTGTTIGRSAQFRNGGAGGGPLNQILLGYQGSDQYSHAIATSHSAGTIPNNQMVFKLWQPGDANNTPSNTVLTLDGAAITATKPVTISTLADLTNLLLRNVSNVPGIVFTDAGGTITYGRIIGLSTGLIVDKDPTQPLGIATKGYVDSATGDLGGQSVADWINLLNNTKVDIAGDRMTGALHIDDVTPVASGGGLSVGVSGGRRLRVDENEIGVYNNDGSPDVLSLNLNGGQIWLGASGGGGVIVQPQMALNATPPTLPEHATRKDYVDSAIAAAVAAAAGRVAFRVARASWPVPTTGDPSHGGTGSFPENTGGFTGTGHSSAPLVIPRDGTYAITTEYFGTSLGAAAPANISAAMIEVGNSGGSFTDSNGTYIRPVQPGSTTRLGATWVLSLTAGATVIWRFRNATGATVNLSMYCECVRVSA